MNIINYLISFPIYELIYGLLLVWFIASAYCIGKLWRDKDISKCNLHFYDSIPTGFTTLGVLGTFIGIFTGLQGFDVNQINESIPQLLYGLKNAFVTSLIGISLSFLSRLFSDLVLRDVESKSSLVPSGELGELNRIANSLSDIVTQSKEQFATLTSALIGETDESISTHFTKLRNQVTEQNLGLGKIQRSLGGDDETSLLTQIQKLRADQSEYAHQARDQFESLHQSNQQFSETIAIKADAITGILTTLQDQSDTQGHSLGQIQRSLGGDDETSLLTQIQKLHADQNEYAQNTGNRIEEIVSTMNSNSQLIREKFDEFSDLLAKSNTEALVEVMKQATEQFNAQMSALIDRLIQENFQELNNSVQRLNEWQQENKEIIEKLTEQFLRVSQEFSVSADTLQQVADNTKKLTDENSHLAKLIEDLQQVMIEDTNFQQIITQLIDTIAMIKENTVAFDETTNKLNDWVRNQMNFSDSVTILLTRLEKIEQIKDINEVFWENTKEQLNEGVSLIASGSERLSADLDNINAEFYERLSLTLQNLDTLIQRYIEDNQ